MRTLEFRKIRREDFKNIVAMVRYLVTSLGNEATQHYFVSYVKRD